MRYDSVIQYDRYVLGATIFSLEIPDPQWNSFDIRGDVLNWLIEDLR